MDFDEGLFEDKDQHGGLAGFAGQTDIQRRAEAGSSASILGIFHLARWTGQECWIIDNRDLSIVVAISIAIATSRSIIPVIVPTSRRGVTIACTQNSIASLFILLPMRQKMLMFWQVSTCWKYLRKGNCNRTCPICS